MGRRYSHYDTLEVVPTACAAVIRAAYKALAARYHDDRDPSPAARERFKAICSAYEVLSDERLRRDYDRRLKLTPDAGQAAEHHHSQPVVRTDGSSTHMTLKEHLRRGGRHLKGCDLRGVFVRNACFRNADLSAAWLCDSTFQACSFEDCTMNDVRARGAEFRECRFGGAAICRSDFSGSVFHRSQFPQKRGEDRSCHPRPTTIRSSRLVDCDLSFCTFGPNPRTSAHTPYEVQYGAVRLQQLDFSRSNLSHALLTKTNLSAVKFAGADLSDADLSGSILQGVDLSDCIVTNLSAENVSRDEQTVFPPGFILPESHISGAGEVSQPADPHCANRAAYLFFLCYFTTVAGVLAWLWWRAD